MLARPLPVWLSRQRREAARAVVPRVGTTVNLPQRLTGEISVGYMDREFVDAGLAPLKGIVADGQPKWAPRGASH